MFYFQFVLDRMPFSKAERLSVGYPASIALKSCKDATSSAGRVVIYTGQYLM
jgi:hypothetical protein